MTARSCPFPECDWEYDVPDDPSYTDVLDADHKSEHHYEKEHAGRVRVQITVETEQMLGGRTPKQVREHYLERWQERQPWPFEVAHVRTEVLQEQDDHSFTEVAELRDSEGQS